MKGRAIVKRGIIKAVVDLYIKRSFLNERFYSTEIQNLDTSLAKSEIDKNENKIAKILPKVLTVVDKPEQFVDALKELEASNPDAFQVSFGQPVIEDCINILLFDLYRKKNLNENKIDKLRKDYSKLGITLHF